MTPEVCRSAPWGIWASQTFVGNQTQPPVQKSAPTSRATCISEHSHCIWPVSHANPTLNCQACVVANDINLPGLLHSVHLKAQR